jgi:hypothetical protein
MNATEKNAAISRMILAKQAQGMSVRDAIDAVLGAGTYDRIAGEVYDALRSRN